MPGKGASERCWGGPRVPSLQGGLDEAAGFAWRIRLHGAVFNGSVMHRIHVFCLVLAVAPVMALAGVSGDAIYRRSCVECHGEQGEGVAGRYDETLHGDRSLESLTRLIERTMPEEHPEQCVGEEASAVARYIFDAFYSPAARARNNPPRVDFLRLSNRQLRESVADLFLGFLPPAVPAVPGAACCPVPVQRDEQKGEGGSGPDRPFRGLSVWHQQPRGGHHRRPVLDRVDRFPDGAAHGRVRIPAHDPNGARLYVNEALRPGDTNRRDDSDARRAPAVIDLWVSSGDPP